MVLAAALFFSQGSAFAQSAPLNDTGLTQCSLIAGGFTTDCLNQSPALHPSLDGSIGRDARSGLPEGHPFRLEKIGGGAGGFDFTALDATGNEVDVSAGDHVCVRDNLTGLVWQVANQAMTWDQANAAAQSAPALCGSSDWRLPSLRELLSIVHYGQRTAPTQFIDRTYFPNTPNSGTGGQFWTSDSATASNAHTVDFRDWGGSGQSGTTRAPSIANSHGVRLVSGTPLTGPSFEVNIADATVTDASTGLIWDRCAWNQTGDTCENGTLTLHGWVDALSVAASANANAYKGHTDWRLPNIKELQSLMEVALGSLVIDATAFPNHPVSSTGGLNNNAPFWSSTALVHGQSAFQVAFDGGGYIQAQNTPNGYYIRLVRGGETFSSSSISSVQTVTPDAATAQASVTASGEGTGYWLVMPASSPAPTAGDLLSPDNPNSPIALSASSPVTVEILDLSPATEYVFYFLARTPSGTAPSSVSSTPFSTQAPIPPPDAQAVPVPTQSEWGLMLTSAFLAALAVLGLRRRRA